MAEVEEPIDVNEEVEEVDEVDEVEEEEEEVVEEYVEEEPDYVNDAKEVKLFGKWEFTNIEVRDISLEVRKEYFIQVYLEIKREWSGGMDG